MRGVFLVAIFVPTVFSQQIIFRYTPATAGRTLRNTTRPAVNLEVIEVRINVDEWTDTDQCYPDNGPGPINCWDLLDTYIVNNCNVRIASVPSNQDATSSDTSFFSDHTVINSIIYGDASRNIAVSNCMIQQVSRAHGGATSSGDSLTRLIIVFACLGGVALIGIAMALCVWAGSKKRANEEHFNV